jgi:hypothetical protein
MCGGVCVRLYRVYVCACVCVSQAFRQLASADLADTALVSTLGVLGACEAIAVALTEQGPKSAPLAEMVSVRTVVCLFT